MEKDSYRFGCNINNDYFNKRNRYDPNTYFTLNPHQRSRSYNIDNRESNNQNFYKYSPNSITDDYFIFNRNAISHSTLPVKYFPDYRKENGPFKKFSKRPLNNSSIRFAPTTMTIDGANRLHSKPLNTSEPYLKDIHIKEISKIKFPHKDNMKNTSRFYSSVRKNNNEKGRFMSYDDISNQKYNAPLHSHNHSSPRNLFRYVYTEPTNEQYFNYSRSNNVETPKVNYVGKNQHSIFYNRPSILKNDNLEMNHIIDDKEQIRRNKNKTKQYMVYFCCLSFKWPPWRIEPLESEIEEKDVIEIKKIKSNNIKDNRIEFDNYNNSKGGRHDHQLMDNNYM
uniref:Homeobox protein 2-like n=1 Tax=Parastrongyloides trichosuri TaxID=131310 RepID=A0A0N4ZKA4_PARTI